MKMVQDRHLTVQLLPSFTAVYLCSHKCARHPVAAENVRDCGRARGRVASRDSGAAARLKAGRRPSKAATETSGRGPGQALRIQRDRQRPQEEVSNGEYYRPAATLGEGLSDVMCCMVARNLRQHTASREKDACAIRCIQK